MRAGESGDAISPVEEEDDDDEEEEDEDEDEKEEEEEEEKEEEDEDEKGDGEDNDEEVSADADRLFGNGDRLLLLNLLGEYTFHVAVVWLKWSVCSVMMIVRYLVSISNESNNEEERSKEETRRKNETAYSHPYY